MTEKKQNTLFCVLAILTIGFPFVGYKILSGMILKTLYQAHLMSLVFFAWGVIDFLFNFFGLCCLIFKGNNRFPVCLLCAIIRKNDFGEALDTMLSFILVALVVGFSLFGFLTPAELRLWNICTVVNVLGAGIARLGSSFWSQKTLN